MLFAVISGPTYEEARRKMQEVENLVDGFELRLDLFSELKLDKVKELLQATKKQVLLTLRKEDHGGRYSGSEVDRLSLLDQLCTLRPQYIDLEYDTDPFFFQSVVQQFPHVQIVCSYHNFQETPRDLSSVVEKMRQTRSHVLKIACMAQSILDCFRLMDFVKNHKKNEKWIGISMGELGKASRILGPIISNWIDYVCLEGEEVAPGQLSVQSFIHRYRYRGISPRSAVYALLGDPVNKSVGHIVHNRIFQELKRDAVYIKLNVHPDELQETMDWIRKLGIFKGLSVTMPLKEQILSLLDEIDPMAQKMGAVNTVKIEQKSMKGFNTDGNGTVSALQRCTSLEKKKVCILGCGGTAKAIVVALLSAGADVFVINRTREKALVFVKAVGCQGGGYEEMPAFLQTGYDIIINTTPDEMPIPEEWILEKRIAMDIKNRPKDTLFLQAAAKKHCHTVYGYELFVEQAILQQQIWFGIISERDREKTIIQQSTKEALGIS